MFGFRRRKETRSVPGRSIEPGVYSLSAVGSAWSDFAPFASTLAAAETAIGLLERALTSGRVTGAGRFTELINPQLLSAVTRGLIHRGEQAVFFTVDKGRPMLLPAFHQFVPTSLETPDLLWLDVPTPGGSQHRVVRLDSVALPHWSTNPWRPWEGVSPLSNLVSKVAAAVAGVLDREARSAHGYVMVGRDRGNIDSAMTSDNLESAREELMERFGDTASSLGLLTPSRNDIGHQDYGRLFLATAAADFGIGQGEQKQGVQSRFGFAPPPEILAICQWASTETLAACGIPPNLIESNLEPGRDSWRRFITATAQPMADRISAELSRVLEVDIDIDLSPSRTSDELVGRARAVGSLTKAGVNVEDALRLGGFDEPLTTTMPPQMAMAEEAATAVDEPI